MTEAIRAGKTKSEDLREVKQEGEKSKKRKKILKRMQASARGVIDIDALDSYP